MADLRRTLVHLDEVRATGARIKEGVARLLADTGAGALFSIHGHACWTLLRIDAPAGADGMAIKTLLMQEILRRGILSAGTHNVTYAHGDEDVARLLEVYAEVLPDVRQAVESGTVLERLECAPLQALFKVR